MKTEKKRTLKGSILFTVVSVLALMVIFMTSALALASSANKRAHKTYSNSQATYTARAAIDSILAAVGTDNNFASAVESLSENGKFDVVVNINDPSLGRIEKASVAYAGKKTIFDPESKTWVEKNLIEISAEVTHGGETITIVSHVIQDPTVQTDDGPGFLTMGGAGTANGNNGSIFGGAYYGMGHGHDGAAWNNDALKYIEWNHIGDYLITLEDKWYLTNENFQLKDINRAETPFVVNGNFDVRTNLNLFYTQKGKGAQIWGDLYCQNGTPSITISDPLRAQLTGSSGGVKFNEIPYLYVDGCFKIENQSFSFGDGSFPFNFFCGSFDWQSGNPSLNCDVYCYDKNKTSKYNTNSSTLYSWSDSVISGIDSYGSVGGNIYSKGSLEIGGNPSKEIKGSVRVEGDFTVNSGINIQKNLVVGGKFTANTNAMNVNGAIYAGSYETNSFIEMKSASIKAGYEQKDLYYVLAKDITYYTEYPVPDDKTLDECTAHADYAWLYPSFLDVDPGTPVDGTNAVDFAGALVEPEYYDVSVIFDAVPVEKVNPEDPDPDLNVERIYKTGAFVVAGTNNEVPESEAMEAAGAVYKSSSGDIPIKTIEEFQSDVERHIFPEYAEKATILGVSGPVKGTEGHLIQYDELPEEAKYTTYTQYSLVGDVTSSCTLTGKFEKTVNVKTSGSDIYILLSEVDFSCDDDPTLSKIVIDDSDGGNVYFACEGKITCNYNNPQELADTQVIRTVHEVMTKWGIEDNIQHPAGPITNVQTPADAVNNKLEINGVDAKITGHWQNKDIIITPPANDSIWIQLENFTTDGGVKIIINDVDGSGNQIGGTVNFYVTGSNNEMRGGEIITQSFLNFYNSSKICQVVSDTNDSTLIVKNPSDLDPNTGELRPYPYLPTPRVNVYSEMGAKFTGTNGFFITGFIRAPYLDFDVKVFKESYDSCLSRLYYDGIRLDTAKNPKRLGIIGCLNVASHEAQNDWLLLYVKDADGNNPIPDANKKHTYASVDYMEY